MSETIFAVSSGAPPSAVTIVRVSGPAVSAIVAALCGGTVPELRRAVVRTLTDAAGEVIDRAVVLMWRGPASFTGEDVAEFHVHGGRAVVRRLLTTLGCRPDCRAALAGEFTRQAFLNGRMDLTAVEGLGDLIAADTEAQRQAALGQLAGGLRRACADFAERLVQIRALLEAAIDFTDESDVPDEIAGEAVLEIDCLREDLRRLLAAGRPAERIRDGLTVVLTGAPNAGKSSLLNALAGRDVAIVSIEAGTTRDVLTVDLDLGGHAVRLVDTAGLRETESAVELEGVRRARQQSAAADLVLLLHAADDPAPPPTIETTAPVWPVRSKADLDGQGWTGPASMDVLTISTRVVGGTDRLLTRLSAFAAETLSVGAGDILLQERQRRLLLACGQHLDNAAARGQPTELMAEEVRLALDAVGAITGAVSIEAVLGVIFSRFCIGK